MARHARTDKATVRLDSDDGIIRVNIQDNGRGFTPSALTDSESFGIEGMKERLELLSGRLTISSQPGIGTEISFEVPIPDIAADPPNS